MYLSKYLTSYKVSESDFSKIAGLNRATVWHFFKGQEPRIATAFKMIAACDGKVTIEDLHNEHLDIMSLKEASAKSDHKKNKKKPQKNKNKKP